MKPDFILDRNIKAWCRRYPEVAANVARHEAAGSPLWVMHSDCYSMVNGYRTYYYQGDGEFLYTKYHRGLKHRMKEKHNEG